jgi:Flp pilus assembly protein TadD
MPKLTNIVLLSLLVGGVLLAVPFTDNFIFDTKKLLVILAGLIILGETAYQLWKTKSIVITLSPFTVALKVMAAAALFSTFLSGAYPYEALFGWGGVLLMIVAVAGLGAELVTKKHAQLAPLFLGGAAAALGLISAVQAFGFGPSHLYNMVFGTAYPHTGLFNLAESPLVALQVMIAAGAGVAAWGLEKRARLSQPMFISMAVGIVLGFAVMGWTTFLNPTTKMTNPLSLTSNLLVVKGVLSSPKTAAIGYGPHAFAHAYNHFKPASVNNTEAWNNEYDNGVNLPLTLVVTQGLFGLLGWAILVGFLIKYLIHHVAVRQQPLTWVLVATLALQLLFPPSIVMMVVFGVTLAYWLATQEAAFEKVKMHTLITRISPDQTKVASTSITHVLSVGVSVLLVVFMAATVYGSVRAFAASFFFYQSTRAMANNRTANDIYELQKKAVAFNPYIDINRRRYGLTNLAVAQALASNPELNEEQRNQALELIQQAIREGRAATMLQPEDARNWEALGTIYQNLIGVATGADQWTVTSYSRAVETDPNNPVLWFQLGSTFYQNKQYAEAARVFAQAAQLKPDYHNALYNLANALRENKQMNEAEQAYNQLQLQLDPSSAEYNLVKVELEQLKALKASEAANPSATESSQVPPSVVEDSLINNPLEATPVQ